MGETSEKPTGNSTRAADELIATLREDGREVGVGEFGLDREVAQQKLRQYQLPDRRFYLLKLAQAAVCQGATRVVFELGRSDVHVAFDGRPFTERDFEGLYSGLFVSTEDAEHRGLRHLAIGLNAALAFGPRSIRVRSGDEERAAELTMTPGAEDSFGPADKKLTGTRIVVRSPRKRDPELLEADQDLTTAHDRERLVELLEQRCAYADVEIIHRRDRLSKGMRIDGGAAVQELSMDGARGLAGFTPALGRRSEVRFVFDGIWTVTERLGGLPDGFVAVVESDRLRMDISESGILQDEAHAAVHREVERARKAVIRALAQRLEADPKPDDLDGNWGRGVLRQALWPAADRRFYRGRLHDPVAKGLAAAPLWNALRGGDHESGLCALDDVLDVLEEGGRIAYVHVPTVKSSQKITVAKPQRNGMTLILETDGDVRYVKRLVGDSLEHPADLELSVARAEERRREKEEAEQDTRRTVWIAVVVLAVFVAIAVLLTTVS